MDVVVQLLPRSRFGPGSNIAFVLACLLLLGGALPARSQEIRGIVRDAATHLPIVVAEVALLERDSVLERSVTDALGRFRIRLEASGEQRVLVTRVGYLPFISPPLAGPGASALNVVLQPDPTPLDPIEAAVEQRVARLERVGFYKRMTRGFGYFLTPEAIEDLRPLFPDDLFRTMPGVRLRSNGELVRWPYYEECPLVVAVDGFRIAGPWTEVLHVNDIEAVEVYTGPGGLPSWLAGTVGPCGAMLVWTK